MNSIQKFTNSSGIHELIQKFTNSSGIHELIQEFTNSSGTQQTHTRRTLDMIIRISTLLTYLLKSYITILLDADSHEEVLNRGIYRQQSARIEAVRR
jgi:hypothetical protein